MQNKKLQHKNLIMIICLKFTWKCRNTDKIKYYILKFILVKVTFLHYVNEYFYDLKCWIKVIIIATKKSYYDFDA